MRETRRTLWAEPEQLMGEDLRPGNVTTTRVDLTEFTLRKWDGGDPIPAGSVVTVIETRPYGSLMVAEMCHEAQASTREAIEKIRTDVANVRASVDAEEFAEECERLTRLTDRFPVGPVDGSPITGREAIERHMRNADGTVLLKRVDGGQDRQVNVDEAFDLIASDPGAVYVALKLTPSPWIAETVIAARDS